MFDSSRGTEYISCALCASDVSELSDSSLLTMQRKNNGCFHEKGNYRLSLMQRIK